MVRAYGFGAAGVVLTAGIWGGFLCREMMHKEELPEKKAAVMWIAGFPVMAVLSWLFVSYGYSFWKTERYMILLYALPVLGYIDGKHKKIPNRLLIVLLVLRLPILIADLIFHPDLWAELFRFCLAGIAASLLFMLFAWFLSRKTLGMGDIKLVTVMGAYLGFSLNYVVLFLSLLMAAAYGLWRTVRKKGGLRDELALAPFLAIGLWIVLLLGF